MSERDFTFDQFGCEGFGPQTVFEIEQWKPIPLVNGLYEASSFGRIRTVRRMVNSGVNFSGKVGMRSVQAITRKAFFGVDGYFLVRVSIAPAVYQTFTVHQLVASAFLGRASGLHVNHMNGIKTDNRPRNLQYVTRSENARHALDVLGCGRAKGNGQSKAERERTAQVRKLAVSGLSISRIAFQLNLARNCVRQCLRNRNAKRL